MSDLLQPAQIADTPYKVVSFADLCKMDIPPRKWLLYPFIQEKSSCMVFASRGIGKTFFCLSIALAVASGTNVLNFAAEQPYNVLYIDGEMNAYDIKERLSHLAAGMGISEPDNLFVLTNDLQDKPILNLSRKDGQDMIEQILRNIQINLIIIDNISALCAHGRENEAESWIPMNNWIIDLRRRGYSVLVVDHAGKNDQNRGTSKKQDILDGVVALVKPQNYKPSEGARFIVKYDKSRGLCGPVIDDYEVRLSRNNETNALEWNVSEVKCAAKEARTEEIKRALELKQQGMGCREIAEQMGIGKTKAAQLVKEGLASAQSADIGSADERTRQLDEAFEIAQGVFDGSVTEIPAQYMPPIDDDVS